MFMEVRQTKLEPPMHLIAVSSQNVLFPEYLQKILCKVLKSLWRWYGM